MAVDRLPQLVVAWQLGARMVRPLSDLGWVAKQISVMVVGYCFLREGLWGLEGFEISESQGVDYACAPPTWRIIAEGSGCAFCGEDYEAKSC